jgi:DedD protein
MEKKKLLLVAVSVGVFLTIVISASILIINPRTGGTVVSVPKPIPAGTAGESGGSVRVDAPLRTQPATVDAAEMVRNADSIQGLQPPPASPGPIQEPNFHIGNESVQPEAAVAAVPAEKTGESSDTLVISVPKPSAAAVPGSPAAAPKPAAGSSSSASRPAVARAKPAAAKPAPAAPKPAPAVTQKPASGTKPAPASASSTKKPEQAPKPAAKPKSQQDYWVQTGAFSAKIRAEGAKETLADKGITSIIDDREVDGKTWYRVRVGPYTSETEARYWLALVQSIDGFNGSQVRSDPR